MISPSDYTLLSFIGGPSFQALDLPENISPQKYFKFALEDINSEQPLTEKVRVNALSNLKRALHLQVEIIADAFGYQQLVGKKYSAFPLKLEFCKKCGIVGPRILFKLNQIRNSVEHLYYIPTQSEVEDYADIVELFIEATNHFIFQFPIDIEISASNDSNKHLPDIYSLMLPPNEGIIYLLYRPEDTTKDLKSINIMEQLKKYSVKIGVKEEQYYEWVQFIVEHII